MTPLAARFRFLALLISLVLPVVGAGLARGDIVAQYTFSPACPPNCDRMGDGYQATSDVTVFATATDVSLSDGIPDSDECYIEDPPTGPPYGFTVLRLQPSNGLTGADSTSPDQAVANDKYFQFTVVADPDFVLNLDNLSFDCARGGAAMPRGWVLRSDVDGFASDIDTQEVLTQRPILTSFTVDLSGPQFQNLCEVTFRIYTFVPSAGLSLEYSNVTLNGSVASACP
jgi:hypothetical protein